MKTKPLSILLLGMIVIFGFVNAASAGGCCAGCGCKSDCCKVCRLVREEKKVKVICWGAKCEDFCIPCPSEQGCKHCEEVCETCDDKCDDKLPHGAPTKFVWRDWVPGGASIHTKTKLMQRIVTKKVPGYKWVVEDLCKECEPKAKSATVEPGEKAPPPPPIPGAKVK